MNKIEHLLLKDLASISFKCECGRIHKSGIKKIIQGKNLSQKIKSLLEQYEATKIFIISDENTNKAGSPVIGQIKCLAQRFFEKNKVAIATQKGEVKAETATP